MAKKKRKSEKKAATRRLANITAIAERLKLTPRRIQQLVGEGLPRVTRGKYDVDQVLDWYIAKLEKQLAGETDENGATARRYNEELRLISARADEQELELAQKRAELVSIADVEKEMPDLVATTKARILTVPARLAPDLLGEESRVMVQAKLEKALKEALAHLAETPTAAPAAAC
jgi:phage terminase Nu1 subunit (DNA packaging protein)